MTTRRQALASAAALAALLAAAPAWAQVTLTLGHGAAPGNPRTLAAEEFARLVSEGTDGNVTINIAGSEQLGDDVSMLTSLRTGALDFTANSQGAASGLVPEMAALGLPFLFEDPAEATRAALAWAEPGDVLLLAVLSHRDAVAALIRAAT